MPELSKQEYEILIKSYDLVIQDLKKDDEPNYEAIEFLVGCRTALEAEMEEIYG